MTSMSPYMVSALEASGVMWVDSSLYDIDRRIKDGDESGWRGDPTMGLFFNPHTRQFEVWGIDRAGKEYKAATHHELSVEIIHKLRNGDPTRNDVFQQVLDHNAKVEADAKQKDREARAEVFDKLAWGIRKDFGHLAGGTRRQHAIPDKPKEG